MPYEEDKLLKSPLQKALDTFYLNYQYCLDCRPSRNFCPKHAILFTRLFEKFEDELD